jgi:hypothetical protein
MSQLDSRSALILLCNTRNGSFHTDFPGAKIEGDALDPKLRSRGITIFCKAKAVFWDAFYRTLQCLIILFSNMEEMS